MWCVLYTADAISVTHTISEGFSLCILGGKVFCKAVMPLVIISNVGGMFFYFYFRQEIENAKIAGGLAVAFKEVTCILDMLKLYSRMVEITSEHVARVLIGHVLHDEIEVENDYYDKIKRILVLTSTKCDRIGRLLDDLKNPEQDLEIVVISLTRLLPIDVIEILWSITAQMRSTPHLSNAHKNRISEIVELAGNL